MPKEKPLIEGLDLEDPTMEKIDEAVVDVLAEAEEGDTVILSSGMTVKVRGVSPLLMQRIRDKFPMPKPPKQKTVDEDGEETWEENPIHPDYLAAISAQRAAQGAAVMQVLLGRGVLVDLPEDESWISLLQADDDTIPLETEIQKRAAYVQYEIITTDLDLTRLTQAILSKTMVTEESIRAAEDRFPGSIQRNRHSKSTNTRSRH